MILQQSNEILVFMCRQPAVGRIIDLYMWRVNELREF